MRRISSVLFAALVVLSVLGGTVAAANSAMNYDAGPNPYIQEDRLDKAVHNMSTMGPLDYENDSGEVQSLPATRNMSVDEPFRVRYDKVEDDSYGAFPRKDVESEDPDYDVTWTSTGDWSTTGDVTATAASTDVDGIEFSGSAGTASYTNFTIDSDVNKRTLMVVYNVDTLTAGSEIEIQLRESDGDYKAMRINSSASTDDVDVGASATGSGYVYQERLSDLSVQGSGDGTLSSIDNVTVSISGASGTVSVVGLDAERKSKIDLGTTERDLDSDGEQDETVELTNVTTGGEVELVSLESMGDEFDDADLLDLGIMDVWYQASDVDSEDVSIKFVEAKDYPNFPSQLQMYVRLEVPTAIDLTHSGLTLETDQKFVPDRYVLAEYAEDAGDKEFDEIDSWTAIDGKYSKKNPDDPHELDGTVASDQSYVIHLEVNLLDSEVTELQDVSTGGAGGGPVGSSGGILGSIWTWVAGVVATIFGFFKLKS